MANLRSISWFLSNLIVLGIIANQHADAKPRDLSLYPLRVLIFQSDRTGNVGYSGQHSGMANLFDGQETHGFDFTYDCPVNFQKSVGNRPYVAKWKKPGKTIEVVGSKIGDQDHSETCEFKVTLHDYVYDIQNGTLSTFTLEQYKVRIGAALPKAGLIDSDINHYPLRLSILAIDWTPLLNGTRTASGKGNLQTQAGLSSVDFTTSCILQFGASPDDRYYAGQWAQEGSSLVLLLRTSGALVTSLLCTLQTNLHTDIYVREASGAIKAVSPEEYRRTMLKKTAGAVPAIQDAGKPSGEPSAPAVGTSPDGQPTPGASPRP
jgi:hypothetical protein